MMPLESVSDMESALLPFTKEWYLAKGRYESTRVFHPVEDGVLRYDKWTYLDP